MAFLFSLNETGFIQTEYVSALKLCYPCLIHNATSIYESICMLPVPTIPNVLHSHNFIGQLLVDIRMEFGLREENGKKENENLL